MNMQDLSMQLDHCTDLLEGPVVYLDYPVHNNIGDILIWLGAQKLLKRNHIQVLGSFELRLGFYAKHLLSSCTTICMHGGGNLGDLYPRHQSFREKIIQKYPDKKIVIFPQTACFSSAEALQKTADIFLAHKNLHIFLRDQNSFQTLQEKGIPNLHLSPDTAHALWPIRLGAFYQKDSKLYFFRRDKEKTQTPFDCDEKDAFDWKDCIRGFDEALFNFGLQYHRVDARLAGSLLKSSCLWNYVSQRLLASAAGVYANHETVITNRLHGMIFAALTGTKCIAFDNSYGKLSSYYDLWLKDIDNLSFIQSGGVQPRL